MPGSTRPGRGSGISVPRITFFEWKEVKLGKRKIYTGDDAPETLSKEEHLRRLLGITKPLASSKQAPMPTLVYFHWPHEHPKHGELTTTLCERTLDNEHAARVGLLFHCVQVDMGASESDLAEMIGCTGKPGFALLDHDLDVVMTIRPHKSSSKLAKDLEKGVKRFRAYYKAIKALERKQKKDFEAAKKLAKKDDYTAALKLIDGIRYSKLRTTRLFDEAQSYGQLLAQKAERERDDG